MRHITSITDLSKEEIEVILARAEELGAGLSQGAVFDSAAGRIMATVFYEPSTRTRLSFEAAMSRLGGRVISAPDMKVSSAAKGETLADTMRVVSSYADMIVLRHYWDGAALLASEYSSVPVINAGDGSHEHPTQTLCDLYTLKAAKGRLEGLTVAICGDLKNGRTVHSLVTGLALFGVNIVAAPVKGMELPADTLSKLAMEYNYRPTVIQPEEIKSVAGDINALYLTPPKPHQLALFTDAEFDLEEHLSKGLTLDAFYMTRFQRERVEGGVDSYTRLDRRGFGSPALRNTLIMHPLPRVDEIPAEMDADPRSVYFKQAAYGVRVRMALIEFILGKLRQPASGHHRRPAPAVYLCDSDPAPVCPNPNCVTRTESRSTGGRFLVRTGSEDARLELSCAYCDWALQPRWVGNRRSRHYQEYNEAAHIYAVEWLREGALAVFASVKQAEESGYKPYKLGPQRAIMDEEQVAQCLASLARSIVEETAEMSRLVLLGVKTTGAYIAKRIAEIIGAERGVEVEGGVIDIHAGAEAIRRWGRKGERPEEASRPLEIEGKSVVVVDDVMNTGWTAKEALSAIWRAGRPRSARLAVLIDRGHRQLPLRPNYVGKHIPTAPNERVRVRLRELDRERRDKVVLQCTYPLGGDATTPPEAPRADTH